MGAVAHAESVQHGGENLISSRTRNRTAAAAGMPRVQPVYFEDDATSGIRCTWVRVVTMYRSAIYT